VNKKDISGLLFILILILTLTISVPGNAQLATLTLNENTIITGPYRYDGNIYLAKNVKLTIQNSDFRINGTITGVGYNSLTVTNSTLSLQYIKLRGNSATRFDVNIKNSKVSDLTSSIILDSLYLTVQNFTIAPTKGDFTLLILRNLKDSTVDGFSYSYSHHFSATSTVAVSIEGCSNLVFSNTNGGGLLRDVNTPHFHMSFSGTMPSSGIVIRDSYFYGGGNAVTTGPVKYIDCVFESVVDGSEYQKGGLCECIRCIWLNTVDVEISLQGNAQFSFTNCTFSRGTVNMNNGFALLKNCLTPNGLTVTDSGDNKTHVKLYLGSIMVDDLKVSWSSLTTPPSLNFNKILFP
jgi:hypothetical protein